jgi:four helix bundle protein
MGATSVKTTTVYQKAFSLAMEIFDISKKFPSEEKFSLTDQVRRSSRSVCICLLEAWRKKRYVAHFISKVTDADMENSETSGWFDFALACNYINTEEYKSLCTKNGEVGKLLHHMLSNPDKY